MYRYLWSNGLKKGLEFVDYSFEEHFGHQIGSYPPRAVLFDHIEGRVTKAGVRDWIRFRTAVRLVQYDPANEKRHRDGPRLGKRPDVFRGLRQYHRRLWPFLDPKCS